MKYFFLVVILFATACTSSVPTLQQYLLRSDTSSQYAVENASAVVGIGLVTVASYIDGLGLVLETSNREVRVARDHQWAEPLRESLRTYLAREISAEAGQVIRSQRSGENDWQKRIDIRIDELHGTANGEAKLVAYWTVFDLEKRSIVAENGFVQTEALSESGYGGLLRSHKILLDKLAAAISATL